MVVVLRRKERVERGTVQAPLFTPPSKEAGEKAGGDCQQFSLVDRGYMPCETLRERWWGRDDEKQMELQSLPSTSDDIYTLRPKSRFAKISAAGAGYVKWTLGEPRNRQP